MNEEKLVDKYIEAVADDEMPELTEEDFVNAKPNRFVKRIFHLDDDLSPYFETEREINEALRLVIRLNELVSHQGNKFNRQVTKSD